MGKNPQLETDGTTIANWYTWVCGGTLVSPTTVSVSVMRCRTPVPETPPPHARAAAGGDPTARRVGDGRGWLQHLRESAIFKVEGLDTTQLRWRPAPAANSLGVLVVHLGYTERLWLRAICAGEQMDMAWRAHMFELPESWGVEEAVAFYREESGLADAVLDGVTSLDLPSRGDFRPTTFRWAVFHLIEETARHAGHMDITRELLDGSIGR